MWHNRESWVEGLSFVLSLGTWLVGVTCVGRCTCHGCAKCNYILHNSPVACVLTSPCPGRVNYPIYDAIELVRLQESLRILTCNIKWRANCLQCQQWMWLATTTYYIDCNHTVTIYSRKLNFRLVSIWCTSVYLGVPLLQWSIATPWLQCCHTDTGSTLWSSP